MRVKKRCWNSQNNNDAAKSNDRSPTHHSNMHDDVNFMYSFIGKISFAVNGLSLAIDYLLISISSTNFKIIVGPTLTCRLIVSS